MWTYRVDLVAAAITRSCPPYKATVGAVSFSKGTLTLEDLSLRNENADMEIQRIALTGPLSTWLAYIFFPKQTNLDLDKGFLSASTFQPLQVQNDEPLLTTFHIKQVSVRSDERQRSISDFTGSFPELLALQPT